MIRHLCLAALAACALPFAAMAQGGPPQDRYIVVLNEGLDLPEDVAADVALRTGGRLGYVYDTVLRGFSITMPRAALAGVVRDPRVAYVEEDIPVSVVAQSIPTGIERIFADTNGNLDIDGSDDNRVYVDVAVLDTGIDVDHPDLYVVGGANCLQSSGGPPWAREYICDETVSYDDDHYHGTHVAGTIGAIDNGIGVVGAAPGARLWAVKVLDQNGSGYLGGIIEGIEWVVENSAIVKPAVINMSLGGSGESAAMNDAVAYAVNNGIAVVVAAGNSDANADGYTPANAPEAITVSALADFNGQPPPSIASPTCRSDQDDTLADFSNWGSTIEIAAPGVCILSTYPIEQGEYGTISGTSMASPHVAGAAALLASNGDSPTTIRSTLLNTGNFDWTDDSGDGIQEPLLDVSTFTATFDGSGGGGGGGNTAPVASFSTECSGDPLCDFDASASSDGDGDTLSYGWDFGDGTTGSGVSIDNHEFPCNDTYSVTLTVSDGSASDTASDSVTIVKAGECTVDASVMYVSEIVMSHKDYGPGGSFKDLMTTVTLSYDSDGDGNSDGFVSSAAVTICVDFDWDGTAELMCDSSGSTTTDGSGNATLISKQMNNTGTHVGFVSSLSHPDYSWDTSHPLSVEYATHVVD